MTGLKMMQFSSLRRLLYSLRVDDYIFMQNTTDVVRLNLPTLWCRSWWLHGVAVPMFGRHSVRRSVRVSDVHFCSRHVRQFTDYRHAPHSRRHPATGLVSLHFSY